MGYSLCWAAVKSGEAPRVHALLGLRATGMWEEILESKIGGASLPTGWYLVLYQRNALEDATLKMLSKLGEVVYCFVEDHVMFSRASGWEHERFLWSVTHDCEEGRRHLEVRGDAPAPLKDIHAELAAKQDAEQEKDVDHVYDVPAELAKALTGFRHDQDMPGMKDKAFEVLEKKNFLSRFLGEKN